MSVFNSYIMVKNNLTNKQNQTIFAGDILKRGNHNKKSWKKRHTVLFSSNIIRYYESRQSFAKKNKPKGIINLKHIYQIKEFSGVSVLFIILECFYVL